MENINATFILLIHRVFFFHFQRIFHSHLTFSIIENNNYTTIIVILLVVVVVVVIVQRLKMAVISINLRNAISLIKKKKKVTI